MNYCIFYNVTIQSKENYKESYFTNEKFSNLFSRNLHIKYPDWTEIITQIIVNFTESKKVSLTIIVSTIVRISQNVQEIKNFLANFFDWQFSNHLTDTIFFAHEIL